MCWTQEEDGWGELQWYCRVGTFTQKDAEIGFFDYIPSWSLHRLLCLYNCHYLEFMGEEEIASVYDVVIEAIERAITGGYFNEKYLA